jgi:murein DD-endopeptidase MepM/ murein hydrolase activator NlpD
MHLISRLAAFALIVVSLVLGAPAAAGAPPAPDPVRADLRPTPVDAAPVDSAPVDSAPVDSAPVDSALVDSAAVDSTPVYSADFVRIDVAPRWEWPRGLPLEVSAPFVAPPTRYAPGHRGIDLASAPGTAVLAPFDGTVSYAGVVVDRPVIAIDHDGDLRSSFEPVRASVAVGDRVSTGQQIGTVHVGGHCSVDCFHFGVRLHGEYLSPLVLLGIVPRAVLLPRDPGEAARNVVRNEAGRAAGHARGWAVR